MRSMVVQSLLFGSEFEKFQKSTRHKIGSYDRILNTGHSETAKKIMFQCLAIHDFQKCKRRENFGKNSSIPNEIVMGQDQSYPG